MEEIFDMQNFFASKGCTDEESYQMVNQALNKFWYGHKFIKFTLFTNFRTNVVKYIKHIKKQGHLIEIHTSRSKTTQKNIVGCLARLFTILQFWTHGIFLGKNKFHFYKNDKEKTNGIVESKPNIVFDDKISIVTFLVDNKIKTICISGKHNRDIEENNYCSIINSFAFDEILTAVEKLIGKREFNVYNRVAKSNVLLKKINFVKKMLLFIFKPTILHKENLIDGINGVIYAPNHQKTVDPLAITSCINNSIHWVVLKRFFDGKDSIFNNSKNPFLCKLTAYIFKRLEYLPIERKMDNPKGNNMNAVRDMNIFLKIKENIGIFAEGTTRKENGRKFGDFDKSFLVLAKKNNAIIQPITILWIKELKKAY